MTTIFFNISDLATKASLTLYDACNYLMSLSILPSQEPTSSSTIESEFVIICTQSDCLNECSKNGLSVCNLCTLIKNEYVIL